MAPHNSGVTRQPLWLYKKNENYFTLNYGVFLQYLQLFCSTYFTCIHSISLHDMTKLTQARREPQRGLGKHSRGARKHLHGALWKIFFWIFLFKMVHSGVLYICDRWRGPQTLRGPGWLTSLPHPLDGLELTCQVLSVESGQIVHAKAA